jgi:hypothetical protein
LAAEEEKDEGEKDFYLGIFPDLAGGGAPQLFSCGRRRRLHLRPRPDVRRRRGQKLNSKVEKEERLSRRKRVAKVVRKGGERSRRRWPSEIGEGRNRTRIGGKRGNPRE